jgi:hypothetical protein
LRPEPRDSSAKAASITGHRILRSIIGVAPRWAKAA